MTATPSIDALAWALHAWEVKKAEARAWVRTIEDPEKRVYAHRLIEARIAGTMQPHPRSPKRLATRDALEVQETVAIIFDQGDEQVLSRAYEARRD